MPLLPRCCPTRDGSAPVGVIHSTCNWISPNFSFVTSPPEPGTISTYPLSTFHRGSPIAPPLPVLFHCERFLPSNKTIASEGGSSMAMGNPGVILRGWGRLRSCTSHFCPGSGSPSGLPSIWPFPAGGLAGLAGGACWPAARCANDTRLAVTGRLAKTFANFLRSYIVHLLG